MATIVIMPKQGQSVESCILTELHKMRGDTVQPGDILFSYETDKASFEEEAKVAGQVLEIFFNAGDEIPVLTPVMVIGQPGESVEEFRPYSTLVAGMDALSHVEISDAVKVVKETLIPPVAVPVPVTATGKTSPVSPRAKALSKKYSVEVLFGSGPGGRVIAKDILAAIETSPRFTSLAKAMMKEGGLQASASGDGLAGAVRSSNLFAAAQGASDTTVSKQETTDDSMDKPLSNMRKLIAKAMYASLQNSAQLTHHLGADARRILELRKQAKTSGVNFTINDLVCFAVVRALKKFPQVNAHFLGDSIRIFNKIHLGQAVDTERGLMVPVVKNADEMTIAQLSLELKQAAEACKTSSINPDLLLPEAASFTVSNLGNYGVEVFTPVINLPQVAILGVCAIVPRPKDLGDGVYGFVPHMGLSLTYDHRALDGGEATRFLKQIAIEIETININF